MKKAIGEVISVLRKQSGLKQDFIAYQLGISTHAYANIERGRSDINSEKLILITNLYGIKASLIVAFAEEIIEVGETEWLPAVIKGILKLSKIDLEKETLTLEDQFLLRMDDGIRKTSFI